MSTQAFSQTTFSLLSLFPSTEQTVQLECPSKEPAKVYVSKSDNEVAIAMDKFLIIASDVDGQGTMDVTCEVEFDHEIVNVAWDASDSCLSVVDSEGTVHLIKKDGSILLSRKISSENLMGITFFTPSDTNLQTLAVFYQGGKCFLLKNIDIDALTSCIAEDKASLGAALKSMKLEVLDLHLPLCRNIHLSVTSTGLLTGLAIEESSDFLIKFSLFKIEGEENPQPYQVLDSVGKIKMFFIEDDNIYGVTELGVLVVFNVVNMNVVSSIFVSTSLKGILAMRFPNISTNPIKSAQLLLLDEDGTRYSCTALTSTNLNTTVIVPHGRENMEQNDKFAFAANHSTIWLQGNDSGETFLCRFSKIFNNISQQLVQQVSKSVQSPSSTPVTTGNFAVVLGYVLASTTMFTELLPIRPFFESLKAHKFPAENILLAAFLLDYASVQEPQADLNIYLNFAQKYLSGSESDVGAEESRRVLKKWRHYVRIANAFRAKFPTEADSLNIDALSPDQIAYHLDFFLTQGKVSEVMFLLPRLDGSIPTLHVASIPTGIHADVILQFIVWQRVHAKSGDRNQLQLVEFQTVESLYHRAETIVAERRGKEAIEMLEYALRMVHEQDGVVDTATWKHLRSMLQSLLFATKVIVYCQDIFDVEYTLEEVKEVGIEGIVFERLDFSSASEVKFLASEAIPQICVALGIQKDELLVKWLQAAIESSILNEEENEETFVIVEKLVNVCECVEEAKLASQAVLKLFQIPNLEKLLKRMDGAGTHIVEKADHLCQQLTDSLGEKLYESLRSFRLKVIASKYGVEVFDIRDKNHLMMLVSIISNNRVDNAWVDDLSYCAYDRGLIRLDLQPVLIRVLISEDAEVADSVEVLRLLFSRLPDTLMTTVIDDAIKALINEFNYVCDACYPEGFVTAKSASLLMQNGQKVAPEAFIAKAKAFIDFYIDSIASKHTNNATTSVSTSTSGGSAHNFISKTRNFSCSPAMENLTSRIRNLHTEYEIFLSSKKLHNSQVCKKVLEAFIKSLTVANNATSRRLKLPLLPMGTSSTDDLPTSTFVHLQKIATLMNLSPQFAINEVLKQYFALNKKNLALKLVYWNSEESLTRQVFAAPNTDRDFSGPLSSSINLIPTANLSVSNYSAPSPFDMVQDHEGWSMLVNQALSLNTAALKHNKTSSQYGYYAMENEEKDNGFEKNAFASSAKILSDAILDCDDNSLCTALDCLSATATTLRVYERFEQSVEQDATASAAGNLVDLPPIFKAPIPSDGLLMQQEASIPLLSAFCLHELQRRAETTGNSHSVFGSHKKSSIKSSAFSGKEASSVTIAAPDIERLVEYFQKTENHMLALQVLSQTWALDLTKAQLLKSSLVALCRKLLTYRDINYDYAVACLSCLPMETMFQELKMAVPTIQNDFSRLHYVALIGEELSFLWDQERQLELFQSLQSHAKWWHLLSSIGLKVDMKSFQHADIHVREVYVQSLIPNILQKSGLNLDLTLDYCRSFDVHPEYASLQYIELMLSLPPSVDIAQENLWITKIASAASGLGERQLTTTLYRSLPKIHALDYERILYVCHWIVNLAPAQVEDQDEDDEDGEEEDHNNTDPVTSEDAPNSNISFLNSSHIQLTGAQKAMVSNKPMKLKREDVDTCQKYIDTIQYLSSLIFSSDSVDSIKSLPSMHRVYQGMKGHFAMRIPFWTLTVDPWSVLTPVLTTASSALMEKLLPLCYLLGIDKEEFTARSLHSMFQVKKRALKDAADEESRQELKRSFVALVEERAMLFTTKLKVWRLVFKTEKEHDKDYAIYALQNGILVVEKVDEQRLQDVHAIRRALTLELTKLQVEDRIHHLLNSSDFGACHASIFNLIDKPNVLLAKVLEAIIEHAWQLQCVTLHHATAHGALMQMLPHIHVITQSPTLVVLEFLQSMSATFAELAALLHSHPLTGNAPEAATAVPGAPTLFDMVSHEFVSRMLTENATGKDASGSNLNSGSSASNGSESSGASAGNGPNVSGEQHAIHASSGSTFWRAEKQHPAYTASDAELRRREDAFFGFALICSLLLQVSSERRVNFLQQLDVIMRGVNRTLRRITSRSRYRAAVAIHYFHTSSVVAVPATDTLDYVRYLYCLSEMHELRLTSTEISLQSALGLKLVDVSTDNTSTLNGSNRLVSVSVDASTVLHTRSLIITWLHDEGFQVSVVELARDLFFLAPRQDPTVLHKLFRHMLDQDFRRSVFTSLAWWEQTPALCATLLYSDIAEALVPALSQMLDDVAGKFALSQTQLSTALTSTGHADKYWLSCSSVEQKRIAWPRIFDHSSSICTSISSSSSSMNVAEGKQVDSEDSTSGNGMPEQQIQQCKSQFARLQVTLHPRMFYFYTLLHHQKHHHLSHVQHGTLDLQIEEMLLTARHTTRWLLYFLQSTDSDYLSSYGSGGLHSLFSASWDLAVKLTHAMHHSHNHPQSTHAQQHNKLIDSVRKETHEEHKDIFASLGVWQLLWPMWQDLQAIDTIINSTFDESKNQESYIQQLRSKMKVILSETLAMHVTHRASSDHVLGTNYDDYVLTLFSLLNAQESFTTTQFPKESFAEYLEQFSMLIVTHPSEWMKLLLQQVTGWEILSTSHLANAESAASQIVAKNASHQSHYNEELQRGLESVRVLVSDAQHKQLVAAIVQHCLNLSKGEYATLLKTAMDQASPAEKKILLQQWKQQQSL